MYSKGRTGSVLGSNALLMMVIFLMLSLGMQPFISVTATDIMDDGKGDVVSTGSRATIYTEHPRILVRDVDWAGGLSVEDIRSRCQAGTDWWGECQRLLVAASDIDRAIPTLAMDYLITGNTADADAAILLMLALDETQLNPQNLSDLALGFDWLYNYTGFDAPNKTAILTKMDTLATNIKARMWGRHIWTTLMADVGSVGLAALAMNGHHANDVIHLTWAEDNTTIVMEAMEYTEGAWPEGPEYLNKYRLPQFLEWLEGYRTATQPSVDLFQDIEDNQGDWLRNTLYFVLYNHMPYGETVRMSDTETGSLKEVYRQNLDLLVAKLGDAAGAEYVELLETIPDAQPTYMVGYTFKHLLWYDPTVPANGLDDLPRTMWFGPGSMDYFVMRTGWGQNDIVLTFRTGDGFTENNHLDSGSFTITGKEPLAIDSGTLAAKGTEHRENYYIRSIAHNTMNIRRTGESFQSPYFGGWMANDGGQRVYSTYGGSMDNDRSLNDYLATKNTFNHFETGNVTTFETTTDYDLIVGDYTTAYNNLKFSVGTNQAKVEKVTREIVNIGGDWVLVMDRVKNTNKDFHTRYMLHMIGEPIVPGEVIGWDDGGAPQIKGDNVTVMKDGSYLHSRTIMPQPHRIIKRGGDGKDYWCDYVNRGNGAPEDPMAGDWRIEVQDDNAIVDRRFLHVMNIQPTGGSIDMPYITDIEGENVIGAFFNNTIALFSEWGGVYDWTSFDVKEEGPTRVLAFDMLPDTVYPIMDLDKDNNTGHFTEATSSANGVLSFTVDLHGNDQVVIGWEGTGDLIIHSVATAPTLPFEGDNATIKVRIQNPTTFLFNHTLCPWDVELYNGFPEQDGVLMTTFPLDMWPLSENTIEYTTQLQWRNHNQVMYAKINSAKTCGFTDLNPGNNVGYTTVYVNAYPVPVVDAPTGSYTGKSVLFSAERSYDFEGDIQMYEWDWGDGSDVRYGPVVGHKFLYPWNFTVTLKVTDTHGAVNMTRHNISITNVPRTPEPYFVLKAVGVPEGENGNITTTYIFNSTTVDLDDLVELYWWDFGDGTNATGENVTHVFENDGMYDIGLTIWWNGTDNATAWWRNLTVANLPPTAALWSNRTSAFKRDPIKFDGLGSSDPDDPIENLTFRWDWGDGWKDEGGATLEHRYTKSGDFTVTLEVVDDDGAFQKVSTMVRIDNRPPNAVIWVENTTVGWGMKLLVHAWWCTDPDNDTMKFEWDFGDMGTGSKEIVAEHAYTKEGTYEVKLVVTDEEGETDETRITVNQLPEKKKPPPPPPPGPGGGGLGLALMVGLPVAIIVVIIVVVLVMMGKRKKKAGAAEAEKPAGTGEPPPLPPPPPGYQQDQSGYQQDCSGQTYQQDQSAYQQDQSGYQEGYQQDQTGYQQEQTDHQAEWPDGQQKEAVWRPGNQSDEGEQ